MRTLRLDDASMASAAGEEDIDEGSVMSALALAMAGVTRTQSSVSGAMWRSAFSTMPFSALYMLVTNCVLTICSSLDGGGEITLAEPDFVMASEK